GIDGDTVVVGAIEGDPGVAPFSGAAYVFVRAGGVWTLDQKLFASDGATGDLFGTSVSLSGSTTVVGAPDASTSGGAGAGAAYVFVRAGTTWTQQQKLVAGDGTDGASFGRAVSVSGDTAVAGSYPFGTAAAPGA